MAGLSPAIYVVVKLYIARLSGFMQTFRKDTNRALELLAFKHVNGRDKPGHDVTISVT